jgi:hypothetical protein
MSAAVSIPASGNANWDDVEVLVGTGFTFDGTTISFLTAGTYEIIYALPVVPDGNTATLEGQLNGGTIEALSYTIGPIVNAVLLGDIKWYPIGGMITVVPGDSFVVQNTGPNPVNIGSDGFGQYGWITIKRLA